MHARNPVLFSLCISAFALTSACTDAVGPRQDVTHDLPLSPVVRAVVLTPSQVTITAGNHLAMTASPMGEGGKPVTAAVTWSSSDTSVATVSPTGDIEARAPGNAVITAKASGASAAAPVTVVEQKAQAESLAVNPQQANLAVGDSLQFSAMRAGAAVESTSDGTISWSSSNSQVATVSSSGIVSGVSAGIASIRVSDGEQTAVATVTVVLPAPIPAAVASVMLDPSTAEMATGDQLQVTATPLDSSGNALTGRIIAWTSSDAAVVSVSSEGLLTALAPGSATVTAESGGRSGSVQVTVLAPAPTESGGSGSSSSTWWSNEPPGLTTLTDQPWNSVPSLGWSIYDMYHNKLSVVPDPTVPTGDPKVLQLYYNKGFEGGSGPALASYKFSKGEVYIGFWWKMSPNWQQHDINITKILYVFQRNGTDRQANFLAFRGADGGPYVLAISNEPEGGAWFKQNISHPQLVPDRWYKIELHMKRSSSDGAPDGVVEWWVDGQLAARYTDAKLRDEPFSEVHVDGVWGGGSGPIKQHEDYQRFGRFYIAGR